jgi:hypothetical protein
MSANDFVEFLETLYATRPPSLDWSGATFPS